MHTEHKSIYMINIKIINVMELDFKAFNFNLNM